MMERTVIKKKKKQVELLLVIRDTTSWNIHASKANENELLTGDLDKNLKDLLVFRRGISLLEARSPI